MCRSVLINKYFQYSTLPERERDMHTKNGGKGQRKEDGERVRDIEGGE